MLQATAELVAAFEQAKLTGALYLSHMGLTKVPAQVFALTDLTRLDLGFNDLTELPADIARLTKLEELWLNGKCLVVRTTSPGSSLSRHCGAPLCRAHLRLSLGALSMLVGGAPFASPPKPRCLCNWP